jgi:hypothetical protein
MELLTIFHPQFILKTNCEPEADLSQLRGCSSI